MSACLTSAELVDEIIANSHNDEQLELNLDGLWSSGEQLGTSTREHSTSVNYDDNFATGSCSSGDPNVTGDDIIMLPHHPFTEPVSVLIALR